MKTQTHNFKNTRVLIVDDDRQIRSLVETQIMMRGYSVDTAENGQAALDRMKQKNYNIIVTDIVMPKINGIELLEKVKKDFSHIAVIMITGNSTVTSAKKANKLGAIYYLPKPINFNQLDEMLNIATNYNLGRLIDMVAKIYLKLKNAHERDTSQRILNLKVELKKILLMKLDVELFNDFIDKKGKGCALTKILDQKFSAWSVARY